MSKEKEEKLAPGTEVVVDDKTADMAMDIVRKIQGARAGIESLSQVLQQSQLHLWKTLQSFYPQIKNYRANYNHDTKIITISYYDEKSNLDNIEE